MTAPIMPAVLAAALLGIPARGAWAAGATPPPPALLGGYLTRAEAAALMPQPSTVVPPADTTLGTAGSGNSFVPANATRPSPVQLANTATDSTGTWSVTWARPFASPVPGILTVPVNAAGSMPYVCNVATRSATVATGRCWTANTATLGGTLTALLGAVVNVFVNGAANVPVTIIGREPLQ